MREDNQCAEREQYHQNWHQPELFRSFINAHSSVTNAFMRLLPSSQVRHTGHQTMGRSLAGHEDDHEVGGRFRNGLRTSSHKGIDLGQLRHDAAQCLFRRGDHLGPIAHYVVGQGFR